MYKNQLQEVAQRSCFKLPSYACIREGPDHAPRFKATVDFNGETFESPAFCSTLRQAEHAAAEVALHVLSSRGPSKALAARVLDETGVYKNLLQETAHRAGLKLPMYATVRSGPSHIPVFSCTVELAGMSFIGEPAKTKKQAQKNAAITAWSALKNLSNSGPSSSSSLLPPSNLSESGGNDEQEQVTVARYLATLRPPETKRFARRDRQLGKSSSPPQRVMITYGGNGRGRTLYSVQCQKWAHPTGCPEVSMRQFWSQERSSLQPHDLPELPSVPSSIPRPQIFPLIRSIFQPNYGQYFLAEEQKANSFVPGISPYLYLPSLPMPLPVSSISQVTIQEIEEKPQVEEECCDGDGRSDCWKTNFASNASQLSPTEIPNSLVSLDRHFGKRAVEMLQGKKEEKNGGSASNILNLSQLESNVAEKYSWILPRLVDDRSPSVDVTMLQIQNSDSGNRPKSPSTNAAMLPFQNSHSVSYLQSSTGPQNIPTAGSAGSARGFIPARFGAPVTIRSSPRPEIRGAIMHSPAPGRSATPSCSRPWQEGMKNIGGMLSANLMASPVHVRSVVPVCSARPPKKPLAPGQEGPPLFCRDNKGTEEPRGYT